MRETIASVTVIMRLGAVVIAATLLPLFLGLALDRILHTAPWMVLIGLVVGVIGAMAAVYRTISGLYSKSG
ncbi:MAG: AtpZ/AtpI family protein [Chloroflexi bacterium]|nr:AtpZ/AtpI family protein [Chloroflexota bacterium]